jgi:hypothetical protein
VQSYVTPHIEGKRYTNIGDSWAATIFSVKFHFFFLQCKVYIYHTVVNPLISSSYKNVKWDDYLIVINNYDNVIRNHKQNKQSTFVVIFNAINYLSNEFFFFF